MNDNIKIDAVITWVDGSDPIWRIKINSFLEKKIDWNNKISSKRYNSIDEVDYTIESIIKFAPYIKNIFIVTDNQIPKSFENFKEKAKKVNINLEIIDHKVIFKDFEDYLPVFNSNAIETMISRIPNLSEHYISFNDDMILIKPTKPSHFFDSNGVPVIRGIKTSFEADKLHKIIAVKLGLKKIKTKGYLGYKRKQDYFFRLMNKQKKICVNHTPFPFRKSSMDNFFNEHPDLFLNNIKFRFRNEHNVLTQSISAFEEVYNNNAVLKNNYQLIQLDSPKKNIFWIKLKLKFGYINPKKIFINVQGLDLYPDSNISYIKKWLDKLYK